MRDDFDATVESAAFDKVPPAGPSEPEPEGSVLRNGGSTFAGCFPLATFERGSVA
jgi:hypothetical protein